MRVVLALALALALAPLASGHIGPFSQNQSLPLGPYAAYIQLQPQDLYSNNTVSFSALITDNATGNYVTDLTGTMKMVGPGGWNKSVNLGHDPTGYLVAGMALGPAGNYSATFTLHGKDGQDYAQSTTFLVYPDVGVRIASADPNQDLTTGQRTQLAIEVDDPLDSHRVDKLHDLNMSIEHWSLDHTVLYDTHVVTMDRQGTGLWTTSYAFPTAGMYHLRFASQSGGFNYADIPILHLYVTDPAQGTAGSGGEHKLPAPALPVALGVLALAALALRRR